MMPPPFIQAFADRPARSQSSRFVFRGSSKLVRLGSPIPPESLGVDRVYVDVRHAVVGDRDPLEDTLDHFSLRLRR
jgi:hypothetical protein